MSWPCGVIPDPSSVKIVSIDNVIDVISYLMSVSDKPETFTLTFRLAENYPVDLYYLMDLSNSMKDDKEKLAALGNKIGEKRCLATA